MPEEEAFPVRSIPVTGTETVVLDDGVPVGWRKRLMTLPDGTRLPVIAAIERRLELATKFVLCAGRDSPCSGQCTLEEARQEAFREYPCPIEVKLAYDLIQGLAQELEVQTFQETGRRVDVGLIVEEIATYNLIGEYIKWELIAHRAGMELAKNFSVMGDKPIETRSGRLLKEKVVHPTIAISEMALKAKIAIQKEFLTTKKGHLERVSKEAQAGSAVAKMLEVARARAQAESLKEIEVERTPVEDQNGRHR